MKDMILIIEDDKDIAAIEKDYMEINGYGAVIRGDGIEGMEAVLTGHYSLILLDVMLPGMDGFEICRKIRDKIDTPILMVTARNTDIDKIRGLGLGADDYIEKPFSPAVLAAKVKSQLAQYRRLRGAKELRRISLGGLTIEPDTRRVFVGDRELSLPNKEFELLAFLMETRASSSAGKPCIPVSGAWIPWARRTRFPSISTACVKPWRKIRPNHGTCSLSGASAINSSRKYPFVRFSHPYTQTKTGLPHIGTHRALRTAKSRFFF